MSTILGPWSVPIKARRKTGNIIAKEKFSFLDSDLILFINSSGLSNNL